MKHQLKHFVFGKASCEVFTHCLYHFVTFSVLPLLELRSQTY